MNSESRIEANVSTDQTERIGGNVPGVANAHSANTVPPIAATDFADLAKNRKERNGQLFVWGAMVEGVYRDGSNEEREQLRQWAKRKLTDNRHYKRAESGFARIEDEAAENAEASR